MEAPLKNNLADMGEKSMLNLELQVIDFETKGNVIRLLLGKHTKKYGWVNPEVIEKETNDGIKEYYRSCCSADRPYGDDWDDVPYDCNAGSVYEQFVYDKLDIAFPFDYNIYESVVSKVFLWNV